MGTTHSVIRRARPRSIKMLRHRLAQAVGVLAAQQGHPGIDDLVGRITRGGRLSVESAGLVVAYPVQ